MTGARVGRRGGHGTTPLSADQLAVGADLAAGDQQQTGILADLEVVLGGLGSQSGTLIAAMLLGLVESLITTFFGPSWSPAVAFGALILVLAFRPTGILGRVGDTRG